MFYLLYVLLVEIQIKLQVCNGFGSVLGALQLILYAIYRKNKGGQKDDKPAANEGGSSAMEMGFVNGKEKTTAEQPQQDNNGV